MGIVAATPTSRAATNKDTFATALALLELAHAEPVGQLAYEALLMTCGGRCT